MIFKIALHGQMINLLTSCWSASLEHFTRFSITLSNGYILMKYELTYKKRCNDEYL